MSKNRFDYLLQRYLSDELSEPERKEFLLFIQLMSDDDLERNFSSSWDGYEARHILSEIRTQKIHDSILRKTQAVRHRKAYLRVAAVAASFLIVAAVGYFLSQISGVESAAPIIAKAPKVSPEEVVAYTRYISLPDGTVVVLNQGSKLRYPDKFSGSTREVILEGEAYFDVKHDATRPFIIHTGTVKTTVLGTAFNITAWPGKKEVTVSVARGRVRVEDTKKVLAVLSADQQLKYHPDESNSVKGRVNSSDAALDWFKQDMLFDHINLREAARILSKRYGIDVEIDDPQLADEILVSSFQGSEPIENVINILAAISPDAKYEYTNKMLKISLNRND